MYQIRKDGEPDRRFKISKTLEVQERAFWNKYGFLVCVALFGFIAGIIISKSIFDSIPLKDPRGTAPKPLGQAIVPKVKANETPCTYDPITYLRCKGEQLGINEYEITKIIATMKCESGLRPDAINKNTNGTFDIGVGQINDVHSKRISRADRMDFVKNIDFIYTLYQEQGLRPWVCARKLGFIK